MELSSGKDLIKNYWDWAQTLSPPWALVEGR
jgi:hypothetical protein